MNDGIDKYAMFSLANRKEFKEDQLDTSILKLSHLNWIINIIKMNINDELEQVFLIDTHINEFDIIDPLVMKFYSQ